MQKMICAILMTMALLAASCSSGSATVQDEAAAVGSPDDAAARLINQLGSDDAATDALIIAMDRGYSGPQILDAVDNDDLQGDGTIQDQDPAGPPLNLVLYSLDGEDEGAYAPLTRSGQSGEVTLASFSQLQQTPIEKLRKEASALAGDSSLGREVIADILIVLKRGITPAHLVEALILGIDGDVEGPFLPGGADYCIRVGNELYCNDGGRYPAETEPDEPEPEPEDDEPVEQPTLSEIEPDETDGRLDFIGPLAEAIDLVAQPGDSVLTDLFFASTEGSDAGLSGNGAFLGQSGESVFSGDSENTCLYISVDFDLPSVSTYQWAGSATFGFYFEGGACPQEGFPPPTDTLQVDATARFDGFMLIVDLTGVDLDDEPLSYTLTAPLREADPDD